MVELGYNYRIDEIRAALGRIQLGKLDSNNDRRRSLVQQYRDVLQELTPQITFRLKTMLAFLLRISCPSCCQSGLTASA